MMSEEERLAKILQLSHSQVLAGKSYPQEGAERYLDDRLYEFRDKKYIKNTWLSEETMLQRMGYFWE